MILELKIDKVVKYYLVTEELKKLKKSLKAMLKLTFL